MATTDSISREIQMVHRSIAMPKDVARSLAELAEQRDTTPNHLVVEVLTRFVREEAAKNPVK